MANASDLINFGVGGGATVGDVTYSAYPLSAPAYLPLNDGEASYLTSSYPALGAIYAPTTAAYSAAAITSVPYSSEQFQFVFGNNVFLGWNGRGNIITTTDFVTWTSSAINTAYAYPATGGTGLYQVDGTDSWKAMTYGRGIFVATRQAPNYPGGGTTIQGSATSVGGVAVSYDNGQTWIEGVLPNKTTLSGANTITQVINWQSIAYGNKFFVANGYSFDNASGLYRRWTTYSPDGLFWSNPTFATVGATSVETNTTNIAYGNGVFVYAVSDSSTGSTQSYYTTATPPTTWTAAGALPAALNWFSVAYGAGVFVAVGSGTAGGTTVAASSATGATWTSRTMPASLAWKSVTYANGYFVAVGESFGGSPTTTDAIATSTNGTTWTLQTTVSANSRVQVAGGKGKFVYMQSTGALSNAATVLSLSAAASSFTLPIVPPMKGMIPYIKAA